MAEHTEYHEMLDLLLEGELPAVDAARLDAHLADCAACRSEKARLLHLHHALEGVRIPVREGFRDGVMGALPEPAWAPAAARSATAARRPFALALVLLVALAGASALLFAAGGGGLEGMPGVGVVAALAKMTGAALITGGGLLGASWSGVGLALGEMFASAPGTLVAFALLLLFLGGLVVTLLRRPRTARQRSRE